MSNANDNGKPKVVTSLRDLPQSIQPPRDLWAGIESQIVAQQQEARQQAPDTLQQVAVAPRSSSRSPANLRWMAAAAVIAALAVGMWIGRTMMPTAGTGTEVAKNIVATPPNNSGHGATAGGNTQGTPNGQSINIGGSDNGGAFQAAYFADPKYRKTREALLKSVEAKLNSLPPDSRQKVISSLQTIHQSMQDLEAALGKDPSNALLQELLFNTYQDEMRVLTTVHEAGTTGEGI